jgi:hypothetical protein
MLNNQSYAHKLGMLSSYFMVLVLVFASLRGWLVLNLNAPTEVIYSFSSMMIIALAMYGFTCRFKIKDRNLTLLRNLLLINLILGIYNIIGSKILGGAIDISVFYIYILPYSIFLFLRISVKRLHAGLFLIFFGISFSVISNFIISLTGADGQAYLEEYYTKLRPLVFDAMSRTGAYLRVGGYTGSYHDSANILGMLGSYYYIKSIINRNWLTIIIAIIAIGAMTLTQSAANIVMLLFVCFIFTIYIMFKNFSIKIGILLFTIMIIVNFLILMLPELLVFKARIAPDGDWDGMLHNINWKIFLSPYFWFGFGHIVSGESIPTEVAFLSGIFQYGIFHACLLYFVLIFPAYVFFVKKSGSLTVLPYLAAIVFGFFSLAHYGSLFRVTNIGIFYVMYALFFINIIDDKQR